MKLRSNVWAISVLFLTAAFAPDQTLNSMGSGGFGLSSTYVKLYNPKTVVTFRGKITGVTIASPFNGAGNSVRLIVRATGGGSSLVELGPEWFVNHQILKIHPRQNVTVTGSKIDLDGRGSIMAQTVVVGRTALVLRDTHGNPYWAANSPSFAPVYVLSDAQTGSAPATNGAAAQPIVNGQPATQPSPPQVLVTPPTSKTPVHTSLAIVSGVVDHFTNVNGDIYMVMDFNGAQRTVYLGPDWYIERQDVVVTPGDEITVNLLAPLNDPKGTAYAQSVTDGGNTLFLRSSGGITTWAPSYSWPNP